MRRRGSRRGSRVTWPCTGGVRRQQHTGRGGSRIEIKRGLSSFFLPQPPLFFFILFFFYLLPPIVFHGAQGCRGCWSPPSTHAGSAPARRESKALHSGRHKNTQLVFTREPNPSLGKAWHHLDRFGCACGIFVLLTLCSTSFVLHQL